MENVYFLASDIKDIDDNIIRISCSLHLKVLFIIIKNPGSYFTVSHFASILNKSYEEIKDAIEFWNNFGIIKSKNKAVNKISDENKKIIEKANIDYVSKRMKTGSDVNDMLDKVETILGRPLSGLDISTFIKLKDFEGLSSSVIILLIQYCVKLGKASTGYIEKVGVSWAKEGINSVESVKQKIKTNNKIVSFWKKFVKIAGISNRMPTLKEKEAIKRWFIDWKYDLEMIKEAYERCVNSLGEYKLSYMDGIIKKWRSNNIVTMSDLDNGVLGFIRYIPTYDISKYENNFGA